MRTQYEDYAAVSSDNAVEEEKVFSNNYNHNKNSASIPYHARENSLPFSYGQIGKTSTPLRNGSTGSYQRGGNSNGLSYGYGGGAGTSGASTIDGNNFNLNRSDRHYGNKSATTTTQTTTAISNLTTTDANMIKAQPKLTSPLLVRKTLNSRSPTRSSNNSIGSSSNHNNTTNTIANTYHYNYGGSSSSGGGGGSNGNGFNSGVGSSSTLRSKASTSTTPTRDDFEELLRERREKVFNEYRSTTHDLQSSSSGSRPLPQPPQRQLSSAGTTARLLANGNNAYNPNHHHHQQQQQQQPSKYNFDFEFNLNLDDLPSQQQQIPRRANTMDRSMLQYRTRDIPVAAASPPTAAAAPPSSSYVERNYHTISSSNAIRETSSYAERPPLEAAYNRRQFQSQQQLQQQQQQQQQHHQRQQQPQRPEYAAAYGNGNASGYGYNEYARTSLGAATTTRSRTDLSSMSPIYATTTKKQVVSNNNSNNIISSSNSTMYRSTAAAIEPELSFTDYPYAAAAAAMASPITVAATPHVSRPETPAFPVTPRTPYGAVAGLSQNGYSPTPSRLDFTASGANGGHMQNYSSETIYQTNYRPRLASAMSTANSSVIGEQTPQEVAAHLVKFAKDSSQFWYKATLSREEAISLLLNAAPGTFVVRDSTTYKNAYGLVVRVAQPPPGSASGNRDELVRHFLIEPTTRGVRLKGCANEPVFQSLSALVYEHSINQLALPCLLRIPDTDLVPPLLEPTPAQKQLLTQGAACNVLWLYSSETESLTGEEAIRKAIRQLYAQKQPLPQPTEVHFKVSQQGITLTDNTRKKFFRKHYASDIISFCAIDPDHRLWTMQDAAAGDGSTVVGALKKTIFAFVARRSASSKDNQCHVFCDLAVAQPASAIVSFVNKTLPTEKQRNYVL